MKNTLPLLLILPALLFAQPCVTALSEFNAQVAAYAAATENVVVEVCENLTLTSLVSIPANSSGATLSIRGNAAGRQLMRGVSGNLFSVPANATLILENIVIDGARNIGLTNGGGRLITVGGGKLVMNNGAVLRNNNVADNVGGVALGAGSTFIMAGGEISGNSASNGGCGGVDVTNGSTFTMSGGKISGNTASSNDGDGGGVRVSNSTFIMSNGEISGNNAGYHGGGVFTTNNGTFTMSGGKISKNNARFGGGVHAHGYGTFIMEGGEISENTASSDGGGVRIANDSKFTMTGGKISKNTASSGGGMDARTNSIFIMTGGEISENTASIGGGMYANNSTFIMSGGEISENTAAGHVLSNGGGIFIAFNTFTMSGGKISGNTANTCGGGVRIANGNKFTMEGGEISGNIAVSDGGGVCIAHDNIFTMKGGKISDNTARLGGGLSTRENSIFNMEGGEISGNIATAEGNGVYRVSGSAVNLNGGVVAGTGTSIGAIIAGTYNLNTGAPGNGVVIAWNRPVGNSPFVYDAGTSPALTRLPAAATAVWAFDGFKSGISYKNGSNEGFVEIADAKVMANGECSVYMRSFRHNDPPPSPEPRSLTNNPPNPATGYAYANIDSPWPFPGPGKYTITATFPETGNYKECKADSVFYICGTDNCVLVPIADPNLVFNNTEQTGVPEGERYDMTGHRETNAGNYTATATPHAGFVWEDGATEAKQIEWSIEQAEGTFPPLDEPLSATYSPTLTLSDLELPPGYEWSPNTGVSHTPSCPLNAGENQQFQATYTCPSGNYKPANGEITINIAKAPGTFPQIGPIEVPHPNSILLAAFLPENYIWYMVENFPLGAVGSSHPYPAVYECPSGNYEPATGNITINVVRGKGAGTASIESWTYGEISNAPLANSATNPGTPAFSYAGTANSGTDYSSAEPPAEAGTYTLTATFPETSFYNSHTTEPYPFEIHRANGTGTVSMEDWYFGELPFVPIVESETNGTAGITYLYQNTDGAAYSSSNPPANIGSYTVEATFPEMPNYNSFTRQANFKIIGVTELAVVWTEDSVFTYNKMVQSPIPSVEHNGESIPLTLLNAHAAAGKYEGMLAARVIIENEATARRFNLANNTKSYEILRKALKPYLAETALPDFEINAAKDTLKVPSEVFTDPETLTKILESIISYEGFATDTETNESDNAENSLKGAPTIQLSYEAPAAPAAAVRTRFIASPSQAASPPQAAFLSRREPTTQKATAIISTESIAADNYILSNPTITILETIDTETAADLIFCHRGTYCTELSEEICQFISGTITASCDIARSSCLIDANRCITNMLTHSCREIGGAAIESCQATPIIPNPENPKIGAIGVQTIYYDLKGTPLGTQKPTTPGVYIEKHGKHTRKIAI